MNRKGMGSIAEPIAQLQRELEEHRRMQSRRAKLRVLSVGLRRPVADQEFFSSSRRRTDVRPIFNAVQSPIC